MWRCSCGPCPYTWISWAHCWAHSPSWGKSLDFGMCKRNLSKVTSFEFSWYHVWCVVGLHRAAGFGSDSQAWEWCVRGSSALQEGKKCLTGSPHELAQPCSVWQCCQRTHLGTQCGCATFLRSVSLYSQTPTVSPEGMAGVHLCPLLNRPFVHEYYLISF